MAARHRRRGTSCAQPGANGCVSVLAAIATARPATALSFRFTDDVPWWDAF
jgi:hypothetical protein